MLKKNIQPLLGISKLEVEKVETTSLSEAELSSSLKDLINDIHKTHPLRSWTFFTSLQFIV